VSTADICAKSASILLVRAILSDIVENLKDSGLVVGADISDQRSERCVIPSEEVPTETLHQTVGKSTQRVNLFFCSAA